MNCFRFTRKFRLPGLLTAIVVLGMAQISQASVLLLDQFAGQDPTALSDWGNAGVTEDISSAAVGNFNGSGPAFNISGGLTIAESGASGSFNGGTYSDSIMLSGYLYAFGTANVSISGFENTLTTDAGGAFGSFAGDNTFTMLPNRDYKLYLFGSGDNDDQNTTFVYGGVSKSTSPVIVGSATDADHYVTYEFTTPADLAGYSIDFTYGPEGTSNGAFNGAAIVALPVPEPTSLAYFGIAALSGLFVRRSDSK